MKLNGQCPLSIVPDTNVLLHFRAFNEIDWCSLVGEGAVQLVITPIVLKELDEAKATHGSEKVRDRARRVLSSIEAAAKQGTVREGVRLALLHPFPEHELRSHGLSASWNDDVLIASALQLAEQGDRVVLVSADTGARLRAGVLGLDVREMPDDLRLPTDRDALEKENNALRERIAQLQMATPIVDIEFEGGHKFIELPVVGEVPGQEWIEERFAEMKGEVRRLNPENVDTAAFRIQGVTGNAVDRYNRDRERFLRRYREYLGSYTDYFRKVACRYTLPLVVKNAGSSPAVDIDIWLEIPATGDVVINPWNVTKPEPPEPPEPPRRPTEAVWALLNRPLDPFEPFVPNLPLHPLTPGNVKGPEFVKTHADAHVVEYKIRQLKHNVSISLDPLILKIPGSTLRPFAITFRINAANVRKDVAGSLHVKFAPAPRSGPSG